MKNLFAQRQIACCLAALLAWAPASVVCAQQGGEAAAQQQVSASSEPAGQGAPLVAGVQQSEDQAASDAAVPSQLPGQAPVGTAAAPYEKASGVSATRPAGAVIAPARQRRVRRIFIRVGIVAGAAAAIAAVALLSRSSSSTPH